MTIKKLIQYSGICLGILFLLSGLTIAKSWADESSTDFTNRNVYALRVSSGAEDGEGVGLFSIRYTSGDASYTEFIQPNSDAFQNSLELAASAGTNVDETLLKQMGYELKPYSELKPLEANSVDTFLVEFNHPVDSVISISAYSDIGQNGVSVEWTCKCLEFFKVNQLNGLATIGGYCSSYYVDFDGVLLAKTAGSTEYRMVTKDGRESILSFIAEGRTGAVSYAYLKTTFTDEEKDHTKNKSDVIVEIDLADVKGAGLEAFVNEKGNSDVYVPEVLALRLYYKDSNGVSRMATIPVLASYWAYAKSKGLLKAEKEQAASLMEFFGQSEKILLHLDLYEFKELSSSSYNIGLIYDLDEAEKACGLVELSEAKASHDQIKSYLTGDSFSITGVSIYQDIDESKVSLKVENNAILMANVNEKPTYNYSAATYYGDTISLKTSGTNYETKFAAKKYTGTGVLRPSDPTQKFVIVMHTTDIALAGTTDALYLKLGYTAKKNGEVFYTKQLKVQDMVEEYYGYWPDNDWEDCSYQISMRAGGFVYALLSLDGVYEFTSAQFTLVDQKTSQETTLVTETNINELKAGTDAWQCQDFYIYQVGKSALKGRHGMWLEGETTLKNGKVETNRLYYRPFNQNMLHLTSNGFTVNSDGTSDMDVSNLSGVKEVVKLKDVELFLSESENSKSLDFATGARKIEEHIEETDWRDTGLYKEMSYSDTRNDLGFAKKVCKYTVKVHVGTEEYATNNGDPGSANFFYFQLVFQNGNSAFVQANQQLSADAFIAGQTASFEIYTNYDYGEVTAVNIIPDDSSSLSSPYDKLKIDSIDVVLDTGSNTCLTWTSYTDESNRWVGIDYVEEGEDATNTEGDSRDLSDYMRTYKITGRRLQSQVLVSFVGSCVNETGTITNQELVADKITAVFHVTKLDGTSATIESSNIIRDMYTFMDKEPLTQTDANSNVKMVTDPETMLRSGQRNYFLLDVDDIKSFDYVEMTVHSTNSESILWQFQALDIDLIVENNGHKISAVTNQVVLDGKTEIITKATELDLVNAKQYLSNQETKTFRLEFEPNDGPITDSKTEEFIQNRIPASINDYLNVMIYMTNDGNDYSGAGLECYFTYNNVYDTYYRATPDLKRTMVGTQDVYYANGVGAKNLVSIYSCTLSTSSRKQKAKVEKVVVQVVREGTIINTYIFPCMNTDVSSKQIFYASASSKTMEASTQYQKVYINLGPETALVDPNNKNAGTEKEDIENSSSSISLTSELKDVGVAIRYKTKTGSENAEYQSPFIFLTDQNITKIGPNRVITLNFDQDYVQDITGVVVSATGNEISLDVKSVAVGVYSVGADDITNQNLTTGIKDGYVLSGWYSYETNQDDEKDHIVYAGSKTYFLTKSTKATASDAVVPISFYLTTMKPEDATQKVELSSDGKIRANILYTKADGTLNVYTIDNILDYCTNLTTKSFTKGSMDSFAIMEKDMTRISSIILQPYDDEETSIQYWGLDELVISYGDGAYVNDIELDNLQLTMNELSTNDTKYTETEYPGVMINLRNISFELDVKSENILNKKKMVRMFDSSIEYQEDIVIQLGPDNPELVLEAFLKDSAAGITVSAKKETDGDADNFVYQDKEENTVFKFAPRIVDGTADTYELTIRSLENPSVMMVIYVEVTDTHELAEDLIDQKVEELDTQKEVMDLAAKAKEKEAAEGSKKETTEESKKETTEESKKETTEESKQEVTEESKQEVTEESK